MKYRRKMSGLTTFFQILMSLVLLVSCIYIHFRQSKNTVEAGTFGENRYQENITFTDLARQIERAADIR